jgi:hypothetical protein
MPHLAGIPRARQRLIRDHVARGHDKAAPTGKVDAALFVVGAIRS